MRLFQDSKLLIASHNSGKVREIADLLGPLQITVVSAASLHLEEPEEVGTTFEENARLKAFACMKASGLPALADDSGLVIPALDGKSGIYSARWAKQPDGTFNYAATIERIREEMENQQDFSAHFVCALSLVWPDGFDVTLEGKAYGHLTFPSRGTNGFGYDPIFIPEGHALTYAEMAPSQKQRISHRAVAIRKMIQTCFTPHA